MQKTRVHTGMTRFRSCAFAASFTFISSSSDRYNSLENRYKLITRFQGCLSLISGNNFLRLKKKSECFQIFLQR